MTQPTRRSVARAAGWTLPVVAVTAAAPPASASPVACAQCLATKPGTIGTYVARLTGRSWSVSFAAILANLCLETGRRIVMMGVSDASLITTDGTVLSTAFSATGNSHLGEVLGASTVFGGLLTATSTATIHRICVTISVSDFRVDEPAVSNCTSSFCWTLSPDATGPESFGSLTPA